MAGPVVGPVKKPPVAGPVVKTPGQVRPPPPAGGSQIIAADDPINGGHYGDGSGFFWSVGAAYRPSQAGDESTGSSPLKPGGFAILGVWPEGAEGTPALVGPRAAMLELAGEANVLLDLAVPALGDGPLVEPLIWALQEAADRGARVRVLTAAGSRSTALVALGSRRGVEVRSVPEGGPRLLAAFLIADRGEAVLAGEDLRGRSGAAELGVLIGAPVTVRAISDVFERDWARSARGADASNAAPATSAAATPAATVGAPPAGGYRLPEDALTTAAQAALGGTARLAIRPLFGSPASEQATTRGAASGSLATAPALVALIDSARSSVRLRLPWARGGAVSPALSSAIARAIGRGAHVQALVDRDASEDEVAGFRALPSSGLELRRVPAAEGAEALALIAIDGARSWIGSGGLGAKALSADRTAGVLVEGPATAKLLEQWFAAAWAAAAGSLAAR